MPGEPKSSRPVERPAAGRPNDNPAGAAPEKKSGMIISVSIVEDDAEVRASLSRLLNGSKGYRCVSQHASGEDALREIPKAKPDVTLMDINLPGMNGVECVRQLKPLLP